MPNSMFRKAHSLRKKNNDLFIFKKTFTVFIIFLFLFSSFFMLFNFLIECSFVQAGVTFVPYAPMGPNTGNTGEDLEYKYYTMAVDTSWKFDWGDGSFSDWITVGESDTYISDTHSWDEEGEYYVRVRYRDIYLVQSDWSPSLTLTISLDSDLDDDGWSNEIEQAYGTSTEDPDDYPLDTDSDGYADDDSIDGSIIGDYDDDNDLLYDEIEDLLGSNSKYSDDVIDLFAEGIVFYCVDTDADGTKDLLYNSVSGTTTNIKVENSVLYLDTSGDGYCDYTYDGEIHKYEPPFEIPWYYILIIAVIIVILVIFILFKKGIIYLYEEEIVVEE
jgi:hypothetical protein